MRRNVIRRAAARVLAATLGTLFGLAAAEAVCKVMDVRQARAHGAAAYRLTRPSRIPGVRFELVPGASGTTPGQRHVVRVNRLGFRGPEVERVKPAGVFRVAVLGDSIAFGRTLAEEEVFPSRLPDALARRAPGPRYEAVNASLAGRDTWEEVALLEHRVLNLNPDLVVIQVCMNDHLRLPGPAAFGGRGAFGEPPWYTYSSLLALLDRTVPGFRRRHVAWATRLGFDMRAPEEVLRTHSLDLQHLLDVEPAWPEWSREFLRARDLCRERGIPLALVLFPIRAQLWSGDSETVPQLSALGREHGIPVLDLIGPFTRGGGDELLSDYTHPNAEGHRVTAETLADFLVEHGLVPRPPAGAGS